MNLIGFALAVLVIELTPGPNMAWLAGLAATEGRRQGMAAVAGIAIGLLANGVLAALGLVALLGMAPQLWTILRVAGAAMMLWLAIQAWRGSTPSTTHMRGAAASPRAALLTGLLINLLNPKAYLFFVVVAPQFLADARLGLREALLLSVISTVIATIIHLAIVLGSSQAHDWLAAPHRTRVARRAFALIMLGVAASFLFTGFG